MAIYDFIKDAISIAQQADNIDLYKKLLEIGRLALDLQDENTELKKRVDELERDKIFEEDIIRYEQPYYKLRSDGEDAKIYYCSTCFGKEKKKIQMFYYGESDLKCPSCGTFFPMNPSDSIQSVYL